VPVLVGPDAGLGRDVRLEVAVPVEVVLGQVEPHRHGRVEALGEPQLERRHLGHYHVHVPAYGLGQWEADVAAGDGAPT
jgi:hypothetical protein